MDDLSKKRAQKVTKIIDKVSGDFSEALNRRELDKLYERKQYLKLKINSDANEITKANARLQLAEVEKSIDLVNAKVDIYRDIDLDVDEEAAKEYIKDNPDIFLDGLGDFDYE